MIIPFFLTHAGCAHRCVFCDQRGITGQSQPEDSTTVADRINTFLQTRCSGTERDVEVAFYGGSFTALPLSLQEAYLAAVRPFLNQGQVASIRISTRPDCITGRALEILHASGVRTIELGAQSLDDAVLRQAGRGHTAADTRQASAAIKAKGFRLGLQLMIGLPGDKPDGFRRSVEQAVSLRPDLMRLHPTLVLKHTPLEQLYRSGAYQPLGLDEAITLCYEAWRRCVQEGISVIRMGLQMTDELRTTGAVVAGPFHPSFGQLVCSRYFLDRMREAVRNSADARSEVRFAVHPQDLSAAIGLRRENLARLAAEFPQARCRVVADARRSRGDIVILPAAS